MPAAARVTAATPARWPVTIRRALPRTRVLASMAKRSRGPAAGPARSVAIAARLLTWRAPPRASTGARASALAVQRSSVDNRAAGRLNSVRGPHIQTSGGYAAGRAGTHGAGARRRDWRRRAQAVRRAGAAARQALASPLVHRSRAAAVWAAARLDRASLPRPARGAAGGTPRGAVRDVQSSNRPAGGRRPWPHPHRRRRRSAARRIAPGHELPDHRGHGGGKPLP